MSNFSFCNNVFHFFKKLSVAEASESVYMRERVKSYISINLMGLHYSGQTKWMQFLLLPQYFQLYFKIVILSFFIICFISAKVICCRDVIMHQKWEALTTSIQSFFVLLGFYDVFNIISVTSRQQFTWSLGKQTRALYHDCSAATGDRTRDTRFQIANHTTTADSSIRSQSLCK